MIMYHATSLSRGNKILKDGTIKKDSEKVYGEDSLMPTTDGYVYLTNDLINAAYYGNKTAVLFDKDDMFFIFRMDINIKDLEVDKDEIEYTIKQSPKYDDKFKDINNPTLDESLEYALSARIRQNIDFSKNKVEYSKCISALSSDIKEKRRIRIVDVVGFRRMSSKNKLITNFIDNLKWKQI
ncbi:hypothetical protein [Clostridium sporogenes]|uniref:hypothetical protein n=1 Tax=Clostridium sporogenes TaxID=1509 RepID=UPI0002E994D7|nr:hypothetical protein [Clostridium sporogenes]NFQ35970.1 hypothetical protein [Clostridium sporogenes]NFQ60564.1 hypothetical protein [Clostridium sporogenes]NFU11125.1 hypothetical protein [Clostridium sporogenes]NFU43925.1 hypothetical protein [Clostridium sporogenes]NFU62715.1 hypothetical protein [Clostridium sporogenes]